MQYTEYFIINFIIKKRKKKKKKKNKYFFGTVQSFFCATLKS